MNILSAFDAERLEARLLAMEPRKQLAFGVCVCEALIPNYEHFQAEAKWGDSKNLIDVMAQLRRGMQTGVMPTADAAKELAERCERAASATENSKSLYVTAAQDACFTVCCLLDFIVYPDTERIVQAATYATDSVDLVIQEVEGLSASDSALERKILEHPLMQRELRRQEEILAILESPSDWKSEWHELTRVAVGTGRGNVAL